MVDVAQEVVSVCTIIAGSVTAAFALTEIVRALIRAAHVK